MNTQGKFIVIAGGEGSGKGTISAHLQKLYKDKSVVFSREPGGVELSEKLRQMIFSEQMSVKTELLLFEAARAEHLEKLVLPSLEKGLHVICDRFDACTYAYQVCGGWNGAHKEAYRYINDWVVLRSPDLYLFCDIDPEIALKRRMAAGEVNRFDEMGLSFHFRVHEGYKAFFSELKTGRAVSIDTSISVEDTLQRAEAVVRGELGF